MRLADFIRKNRAKIIAEWEVFAQSLTPASEDMNSLSLRDHIEEILSFIIKDIESDQTGQEQINKSHGEKAKPSKHTAAQTHAALRLAGGFDIDQMVSEYRALRASVIKLWGEEDRDPADEHISDLTRFNESIDQEVMESVSHYTKQYNHSKELVLGILSHDIRTPISASHMCAELVLKMGSLNERQSMLIGQIIDCTSRADEIVTNLFDLTKARFGSGLPIVRASMDMAFVSRRLVEEMNTVYPANVMNLEISGNTEGEWDKARIAQVFSNLIGNAVQYGFKGTSIDITVKGTPTEIILSVHNMGVPIPTHKIGKLFDSLSRGDGESGKVPSEPMHLGLGLYIAEEIVAAHGGKIGVESSEKDGTTFTVYLPRIAPAMKAA